MRDPKAEASRWLAAAREELAWTRHAAAGGFHAPACFHAQQGAEKAVKAVQFLGEESQYALCHVGPELCGIPPA